MTAVPLFSDLLKQVAALVAEAYEMGYRDGESSARADREAEEDP